MVQDANDAILAEVNAAERLVKKNQAQIRKAEREILKLESSISDLEIQQKTLIKNFENAKKQSARLKKFVWVSDDPNIVELRNQIMMAAKLIQDNP